MSKIWEKESLECVKMHIWAAKTQKLPGPLSGPWTPAAKCLLHSHDSASLHRQLSASEAGAPPLTKSWIHTCAYFVWHEKTKILILQFHNINLVARRFCCSRKLLMRNFQRGLTSLILYTKPFASRIIIRLVHTTGSGHLLFQAEFYVSINISQKPTNCESVHCTSTTSSIPISYVCWTVTSNILILQNIKTFQVSISCSTEIIFTHICRSYVSVCLTQCKFAVSQELVCVCVCARVRGHV